MWLCSSGLQLGEGRGEGMWESFEETTFSFEFTWVILVEENEVNIFHCKSLLQIIIIMIVDSCHTMYTCVYVC